MNSEFKNWKWMFFCFSLIAVNILLIFKYYHQSGWDFQVYCSAVRAWENAYNPYLVGHLRLFGNYCKDFPFVYLPFTIFFFKPLCLGNPKVNYYIFWLILLALTFFIIRSQDKTFKPLFLITLLMTAFYAALNNFWSGNIGLVEMFIFLLVLYYIANKRYYLAAFFLGLLSTIKITPLLLAWLFAFADIPRSAKIKVMGLIFAVFILISVLSYAVFPDVTPYYYMTITGKIANQDHAIREEGNQGNPAPFFFIRGIAKYLFGGNMIIFLTLFGIFAFLLFGLFLSWVRRKGWSFLELFCLGTIPFMLILPRLKSYSFALLIPCIYFLTKDLDLRHRFWTLFIVSACPLILWGIDTVTNGMPGSYLAQRMLDYRQSIFLLIFFVLFSISGKKRQF